VLNRIPKENKACRKCLDIDHEFVRPTFELILLVEDKIGDRAELMLRGEVCLSLSTLIMSKVMEDPE